MTFRNISLLNVYYVGGSEKLNMGRLALKEHKILFEYNPEFLGAIKSERLGRPFRALMDFARHPGLTAWPMICRPFGSLREISLGPKDRFIIGQAVRPGCLAKSIRALKGRPNLSDLIAPGR